ncbi:hypothetical protein [Nonomuraea wenchangensis]|uniref:hypothetical protein n=1 Tax=Nonomuraea wenchangensis TaxID=568860 RepID=UPI00116077BA|nr:hypothetical protein [Nonomuraea wenchangensis]
MSKNIIGLPVGADEPDLLATQLSTQDLRGARLDTMRQTGAPAGAGLLPDPQIASLASMGVVYGFEPVRHLDARKGRSM